jgi:hypothetical protein
VNHQASAGAGHSRRWVFLPTVAALAVAASLVASTPAIGQPRPAPKGAWSPALTPDGQPDIQGYWNPGPGATNDDIEIGTVNNSILGRDFKPSQMIVDPPDRKIPYQPWARERRADIKTRLEHPRPDELDPAARCDLPGVPRVVYMPFSVQILQPPGFVVILSENMHTYRIIPLDQRPHLGPDIKLWMGDARGHWEGRTLVVDVTNNNEETWFDTAANFHSDALHVVERWTFSSADTIDYEATIDDPKTYTKPWKLAFPVLRSKEEGYEILEFACHEGNRAEELMLRQGKPPKDR